MSRLPRHVLRLADLPQRREAEFTLAPAPDERAAVAEALGILGARKLTFAGRLIPEGRSDWRLEGRLGATVVQECVATLAPVTTRIDEEVVRRYVAALPIPGPGEVEMPEDDTVEALPAALDVAEVMVEALSLALPPFPRAPDAPPADAEARPSGAPPIEDSPREKPFAGLAALRDRMTGGGDAEE